jgi:double-stranded uracil-DNA glycosylase
LYKPTKDEIQAAHGRTVPDVIAPGLNVLFCGINPGLYSAAIQHHFARPGNRFWKTLHRVGFTPRILSPYEEQQLLAFGYGLTNLVERATAQADEIAGYELTSGVARLTAKVRQYQPKCVAVLGLGAYRSAFKHAGAALGLQAKTIDECRLWVLPNPSGLNVHYPLERLGELYAELRQAFEG